MLKLIMVAFLVSVSVPSAVAQSGLPSRSVDLNDHRVMDGLRASDPGRYKKVQQIIQGVKNRSVADVPRWIRTSFQARDVLYSDILLTSFPGQRELAFILDDTLYHGRVYVSGIPGHIVVRSKEKR